MGAHRCDDVLRFWRNCEVEVRRTKGGGVEVGDAAETVFMSPNEPHLQTEGDPGRGQGLAIAPTLASTIPEGSHGALQSVAGPPGVRGN